MKAQFGFYIVTVFFGFFAMMNPFANTPVFLALTQGMDVSLKKAVAKNSLIIAFIIVSVFSIAGHYIFDLFGITITALRIAGGVLIFLIGYQLLQGETSKVQTPTIDDAQKSLQNQLSIAISPLAVPLMAGPGTIVAAMNFVADGSIHHLITTLLAFAVLCVITYGFYIFGESLIRYIGHNTVKVIGRLMGLILSVIGVQMLIIGITDVVKSLS